MDLNQIVIDEVVNEGVHGGYQPWNVAAHLHNLAQFNLAAWLEEAEEVVIEASEEGDAVEEATEEEDGVAASSEEEEAVGEVVSSEYTSGEELVSEETENSDGEAEGEESTVSANEETPEPSPSARLQRKRKLYDSLSPLSSPKRSRVSSESASDDGYEADEE